MDIAAILALIVKGMAVISSLVAVGQSIEPAIKVITDLVTGAQNGTVTDQQLADTEATLDAMIADFNTPVP